MIIAWCAARCGAGALARGLALFGFSRQPGPDRPARDNLAAGEGARPTRADLLELRLDMTFTRILISGASGPIGAALLPSLKPADRPSPAWCDGSRRPRPDRLGPVPSFVAGSCLRLRRGHSPGWRVHRRPLDRGQEAAHPRKPRPGHGPPRGSSSASRSATACIHFGFRGRLLRQSRRRDFARGQPVRRGICRGNLPPVGSRRPARGQGGNPHRANAHLGW